MSVSAIITCAGQGTRCGLGYNKILYDIGGMPLFGKTLLPFLTHPKIQQIVITADLCDFEAIAKYIASLGTQKVVLCQGGASRTDSVRAALLQLDANCQIVLIHDGARPFVTKDIIDRSISCAIDTGACTAAVALVDTIKKASDGKVISTINRCTHFAIQTPQAFKKDLLLSSYQCCTSIETDDCTIVEKAGHTVHLFDGDVRNIKITTAADLERFVPNGFVVGTGFDTHQLVEGRALILGGVEIPHTKGLLGHSDADVLIHAIMDSLLSCAHLQDIGCLFPDTSAQYCGISSVVLLQQVSNEIKKAGLKINNISAVILAQKPKLMQYIPYMVSKIASTLGIDESKISIGATTTEGLGFVGREEGISCKAISSCHQGGL